MNKEERVKTWPDAACVAAHFDRHGGYWLCRLGDAPAILRLKMFLEFLMTENPFEEDRCEWMTLYALDEYHGVRVVEPVDRDGRPFTVAKPEHKEEPSSKGA